MSDTFDSSQRDTIWNNYFDESTSSGTDPFGRQVYKDNFEADHIWPVVEGGKTVVTNGMPLHSDSNIEKGDNMYGVSNGKTFQVQGTTKRGVLNVDGIAYDYKGKR